MMPAELFEKVRAVSGDTKNIRFIATWIVLTLAALLGREVLPERTLDLLAPSDRQHFLAASERTVEWVDESHFHLRCHYANTNDYQSCGITFLLTRGGVALGMDLRSFDSVVLDVAYRGNGGYVRLGVRDFDPRFSREQDGNSARMQSTNIRAADLEGPLTIQLSELVVPEWWITQFNLPREFNRPSLENVTAMTVDLPVTLANTVHELQLRRLELRGEWISREALYLGILCAWMLAAAAAVVWQLTALRRQQRHQARDIEALVARTVQLRDEQDNLRRQAAIDRLTGVLNRRGVEQALADLGERGAEGVALVMVDIDHFKGINDTHGHDAGDQVLQRVAAVMVQSVRADDVLGRWGGEEFVVACVRCTAGHAAQMAEKIRQRIEQTHFGTRHRIHVTASFGVAGMQGQEDFADTLRRADEALYRAKSEGRNRVVVVEGSV
jgi:diguanylate cyclase (GGDEF)-like protein